MKFTLSQQHTVPFEADSSYSYYTIAVIGKHTEGSFYTYDDEKIQSSWVSGMHFAFFDKETKDAWKGKILNRNGVDLAILD